MSSYRNIDLTGKRFGKWLVIGKSTNGPTYKIHYDVVCDCGTNRIVQKTYLTRGRSKSCGCGHPSRGQWSKAHKGSLSPHWKGGKFLRRGYVMVQAPDHPRNDMGYVREHIIVVEKSIGRLLLKEEQVHHINGVKDDNRLENLELWSKSHPSGQRVSDKVSWAKEILQKYEPESLKERE